MTEEFQTTPAFLTLPEDHHREVVCPAVEALRGGESLGRALIVLSCLAVILVALCIFLPAIFAGA